MGVGESQGVVQECWAAYKELTCLGSLRQREGASIRTGRRESCRDLHLERMDDLPRWGKLAQLYLPGRSLSFHPLFYKPTGSMGGMGALTASVNSATLAASPQASKENEYLWMSCSGSPVAKPSQKPEGTFDKG